MLPMPPYDDQLFSPPAPVAKVALRDPNSGRLVSDVLMLIDSGADVTMLPATSLKELAVQVEAGDGYEVMAFDGDVTISRVVRLDLLFLGRTFKGQFLIIEQPWGVLGRNLTNHLRLLLDGPSLTWEEARVDFKMTR